MANIIFRAFAVTAFVALAASAAVAGPTSELKVAGVIKPPACTPLLAAGGEANYGVIPATSLTTGVNKTLETKQIGFSIQCETGVKMAVRATDNRASSIVSGITFNQTATKTDAYNYGLGSVAGKNVGGYSLSFDAASTVDGVAVKNIFSPDGGKSWQAGAVDIQHDGQYFSFGDSSNMPVSFKNLNAKINVKPVLNKPENLPLYGDVPLSGSTTLELLYL
ncbi:DUF1120 domain-containing protein [Herbaspirillum robiniae]|uniref:DUF1120 domain-containing protein n=1 Tax=Herbaspirillum robiniae TaxID=2014887 RepID=UPI003D76E1CD